ncbi:MAG TPA: diguanylate cyclase [Opitutaceae bacterium]
MLASCYNVLLIQDQALLARVTEQMLKKAPLNKYSLTHRATLAEGLEKLRGEDFDVILLDIALSDAADLGPLQQVLSVAPEVPVVVLTSTPNYKAAAQAIKLGAQDFLVKGDFNFLTLDRAIVYAIERQVLRRTIQQLAVIDELTGLYNRRGYHALYPDIQARVRTSEAKGYLCCFDLDRFKEINDQLGHQKGDEALVEFAANLRSIFPKDALLVRMGGDEFVALGIERAPGSAGDALNALSIVLSVRNTTGATVFTLAASSGLAYFDRNGPERIEDVVAVADAALYKDKESRGRGRSRQGAAVERA